MLYLVLSRYWYRTFIQTCSVTSPLDPHWEMDKTFSLSYSPSQITYAEAVGFSRFRFHIPDWKSAGLWQRSAICSLQDRAETWNLQGSRDESQYSNTLSPSLVHTSCERCPILQSPERLGGQRKTLTSTEELREKKWYPYFFTSFHLAPCGLASWLVLCLVWATWGAKENIKQTGLEQGCQIGHFLTGQFQNIWSFFDCAGHEKTHLAILWNLAIFSVCCCKIKFSLNILFFGIFLTVFMSLIVPVLSSTF